MLINRRVRVAIAFDGGRAEGRCHGPTPDGDCPHVDAGGRVACAGAEILPLHGTDADGRRLLVDRDCARCPLAAFTQTAPAPWD